MNAIEPTPRLPGKILIVGATGLIGGAVARQLATEGHAVRALVRDPSRASELAASGIELVVGDLADVTTLGPAIDGVTAALLVTNLHPDQIELQNRFVSAAAGTGMHIVKVSGFMTRPDSPAQSGRWHATTEHAIEQSGLPWTFLRAPFFMQNLLRTTPHAAVSGEIAMPLDTAEVALVDALDIAAVAAATLGHPGHCGQAYLVTGPEAMTFRTAAKHLAAAAGRPITFRLTTMEETRATLEAAGTPPWRTQLVTEFYEGFSAGHGREVTDVVASITGRPATTLPEFLKNQVFPD